MKISLATTALCALLLPCGAAFGQSPTSSTNAPMPSPPMGPQILRTFHLHYASSQAEQNEILTAIRNLVSPPLRIMLVPSRDEIAAIGAPEDMKMIEDLLARLDVPNKLYRLTYTFTESDGGKRIGVARYTMTLAPGQRMQMKQGSRVPLVTGSVSQDSKPMKQTQYLDVGLNFDSEVETYGAGVRLKSKVEQSSVSEEKSGMGPEDPVIRQTLLEGVSTLAEGKSMSLGELDIVGSTRHLQVEVVIEAVK
jgi:type II secretory pathway component GspD/PulD (secretin)